jgi:hypothetical protein
MLLGSMSAYYHTELGAIFVGILLFVGAILFLYQGYTDLENRALDIAGVLAWCVALFPGAAPDGIETFTAPTLHGISAILFFLCIVYVCLWRYRDTLDFVQDEGRKRWYRWIYHTLATLMVVLPLLAAALLSILGQSTVVFWVEAFAVWVFAGYWIVKSREVTESLSGVPDASVSYFLGAQR